MDGDAAGVRQAAHSLKSSSQNVGAMGLAAMCLELEALARDERLEKVEALVERLIREHEERQGRNRVCLDPSDS